MSNKLITVAYLITGLGTGGAEVQLYQIIKKLDQTQFQPVIISMMDVGSVGQMLIDAGFNVHTLCMKRGVPDLRAILKLFRILRREKVQVLHTHMFHANLLGRIVGRVAGVTVIISTIHTINFGGKARRFFSKFTEGLANLTTIVSEVAARKILAEKLVAKHKLLIVPNGVDLERFRPDEDWRLCLREQMGIKEGEFVWIAIGRFEEAKNFPLLIRAFSMLVKVKPTAKLLIAGDGHLRLECESLVRDLHIYKKIQFLGIRKDVPDLLRIADGYVMSSSWEGMPLVLQEAAATALPIISTKVGGVPEVVQDGVTGILVQPESDQSLANGMLQLMMLSKEERQGMGAQGRKHVADKYSLSAIVRVWECLYKKYL